MTFGEYLERAMKESETCYFSICVTNYEDKLAFYIHPTGRDGLTRDFIIQENGCVEIDPRVTYSD